MNSLIYLAPVKGITDTLFRNVFASHFSGIDLSVAPFITKSDSEKKIGDLSPAKNLKLKTIPQILTKSSEQFTSLAFRLMENGSECINLNIGCPFHKVLNHGEGAAMLSSPSLFDEFLGEIFRKPLPHLSVKMRLGMVKPDEILQIISVLNNYDIKEIIIHARTAEQMYDSKVNFSAFNEASIISNHNVIYNGDITSYKDIDFLSGKLEKVYGWMIGRGMLSNPFLAEEIRSGTEVTDDIKIMRIKKFIDDLLSAYNSELKSPAHVLDKMRGIWSYLSTGFENGKKIEKKIKKAGSIKHYTDEIEKIFNEKIKLIKPETKLLGIK